jgi:putative serine protease PepD
MGCVESPKYGGGLSGGEVDQKQWLIKIEQIKPAVVKIEVEGCQESGSGSGFFTKDWLVTNHHVMDGASSAFFEIGGEIFDIKKWHLSQTDDLALIPWNGDTESSNIIELGQSDPVPGDLVAAAGFPWGGPEVSSFGRILSENEDGGSASKTFVIETNLDIHPGNSGGPLLDAQGKVIGVMYAIDTATNSSLALPLSRLVANLESKEKAFIYRKNC